MPKIYAKTSSIEYFLNINGRINYYYENSDISRASCFFTNYLAKSTVATVLRNFLDIILDRFGFDEHHRSLVLRDRGAAVLHHTLLFQNSIET